MGTGFQKIGFILGSGPTSVDTHTVVRWASAALESGHQVSIFLVGEGIYNALPPATNKNASKLLHRLCEQGATISVCSNMAKARGVVADGVGQGITYGLLLHFSEMIAQCDKLLAFNR